ncbi:APC family permease [Leuconostocaceae bacterium ESL0958]|nr:APC family permease [Leuconostocaceae bacterium ESL0958]
MKDHKIGLVQLILLGLGSLIGSGWLFGSWEATRVAGPAAVISWVVGAVVIGVIAYTYLELGTMFPQSGGMSKFAQYTHGSLLGFIASWANWVSLITLIPIEAVAAVQYMATWPWSWANWTHHFLTNGTITTEGLMVVFLFIIIFTLLNYWSVSLLTRFTSAISFVKLGVPVITIITLMLSGFHPANYGTSLHEFMPYGSAPIFAATTVSGIIFSFNAFQTIINFGSEVKHPGKDIFRGVVISMVITTIMYVIIQSTYITSMDAGDLSKYGWNGIDFESPFADLAILMGLNWLSVLLYTDAFVSPFGTGVSFAASTARVLQAMAEDKHIPAFIGKINKKYGMPRMAMITDAVLSMIMVATFRSWSTLAAVIATATLIAYMTGPVTVMSLRKMAPNFKRPFKSNIMPFMAPLAFVLASLATYWAMWPTTVEVILIIVLGLPFYFFYEWRFGITADKLKIQFKGAGWLIAYLVVLSIESFIGSHEFSGNGLVPYPLDFVMVAVVAIIFYIWGLKSRVQTHYLDDAKEVNDTVRMDEGI